MVQKKMTDIIKMSNPLVTELLRHSDFRGMEVNDSPDMRGITSKFKDAKNAASKFAAEKMDARARRKIIDASENNIYKDVGGDPKGLKAFISVSQTMERHKKAHFYDKSGDVDNKYEKLMKACSQLQNALPQLQSGLREMKGIDNPSCMRKEVLAHALSTFSAIAELNTFLDKEFRSRDVKDVIQNLERLGDMFGDKTFGSRYELDEKYERFKTQKLPSKIVKDLEEALTGADETVLKSAHKAFKLDENVPVSAETILEEIRRDTVFEYLSRRFMPLPSKCDAPNTLIE